MRIKDGRSPPDKKGDGPRRSFGGHATTHRQEESETLLAFSYGNPLDPGNASPICADTDVIAVCQHYDPDGYFRQITVRLIGHPDVGGQREREIRNISYKGRNPDAGATAGVPAPPRPPTLTGGAAVEIPEPILAA